jgi:hypothetical protein
LPRISLPKGKTFCAIRKTGLRREIYDISTASTQSSNVSLILFLYIN